MRSTAASGSLVSVCVAQDWLDIRGAGSAGVGSKHLEHLRLQIARQNRSLGANPLRQSNAVITGPGADVRHGRAGRDLECVEHRFGLLLVDPSLPE